MNQTIIIGNLTADPVKRATKTGKELATFTVAVNEGFGDNKSVTYFNCTAWEKQGELVSKYLVKGRKVCVVGSIRAGAYVSKQTGNPVGTLELTVRQVEFLSSKGDQETEQSTTQEQVDPESGFAVAQDEELPF